MFHKPSILMSFILVFLIAYFFVSSNVHAQRIQTESEVKLVARGLNFPWGMTFMPNGNILVTERVGRLRIVSPDGHVSEPVKGVPKVFAMQQGGLLDVEIDPKFTSNQIIYLSYAEPEGAKAGTAVARAKLVDGTLENLQVIFRQVPKTVGAQHFGSRLVFAPDGNLFVTLGDRGNHIEEAQNLSNHLGKLIRIRPDGSIPKDNPFVKNSKAKPEIWSYGHRHIQGAALNPETGELWIHEHGPRGGDEINIPKPGKNYGWPEVSYGMHYSMLPIEDEHAQRGFEEPIFYWTPSIAPSGMMFYSGSLFPGWRNNLFIGALAGTHVARLVVNGNKISGEEQLLKNTLRFRDVEQGPDGAIYLLTDEDDGKILKVVPKTK